MSRSIMPIRHKVPSPRWIVTSKVLIPIERGLVFILGVLRALSIVTCAITLRSLAPIRIINSKAASGYICVSFRLHSNYVRASLCHIGWHHACAAISRGINDTGLQQLTVQKAA